MFLEHPATSSYETSGSIPFRGMISRASAPSWAPTTSSSALTTLIPKAWPMLSIGSNGSLTSIRREMWLNCCTRISMASWADSGPEER
jgi:hypothetical protein